MPRPAAKRNRLAKASAIASKGTTNSRGLPEHGGRDLENASSKLLSVEIPNMSSRYPHDTPKSGIAHQDKNHTPSTRPRPHTTESPRERQHTDSRPPTRARGYSSTLSLGGLKGDMTSKVPGTPAYESSVLSNFKRRPRQPSILQMMQAEDGALDLDDDNDDDFLGGLSPGDESTPLNFARGKSLIARRNTPSRPGSLSPASSTASRKRKRDHEKFQVPGSPSDIVENTQNSLPCSDAPDNDNDSSDNLSLTRGHAYMFGHQTMAAPLSSSPVVTPGHTVTPLGPNHSAPQTTEEAKESTGQVHHSTIPISTESLQDKVLPRRRQRQRRHRNPGDFEVPSDEDGYVDAEVDDDELSYVPAKVSKSQRKPLNRSRPVAEMRAKSKLASRKKPPIHGKAGVDKENREGDMPSDSIDSNPAARFTSEELKAQAMKFAEVDKWQLEFEDVAMSGSQADSSGDL